MSLKQIVVLSLLALSSSKSKAAKTSMNLSFAPWKRMQGVVSSRQRQLMSYIVLKTARPDCGIAPSLQIISLARRAQRLLYLVPLVNPVYLHIRKGGNKQPNTFDRQTNFPKLGQHVRMAGPRRTRPAYLSGDLTANLKLIPPPQLPPPRKILGLLCSLLRIISMNYSPCAMLSSMEQISPRQGPYDFPKLSWSKVQMLISLMFQQMVVARQPVFPEQPPIPWKKNRMALGERLFWQYSQCKLYSLYLKVPVEGQFLLNEKGGGPGNCFVATTPFKQFSL